MLHFASCSFFGFLFVQTGKTARLHADPADDRNDWRRLDIHKRADHGVVAAGTRSCIGELGRQPSHEQQAWCAARSRAHGTSFQFAASNTPLEWMEKNEFVFTQGAGVLLHVAKQFRPDLLHSSQFCFGALSLDIPKLVTAHSDVLSWACACRPQGLEESRWLRQYRALVAQGLQSCDAVASPTRWMALELARHYNDLPPSYVIRHGRSLDAPESRLRTVQAVTVGPLWDEAKNIEMLRAVNSPIPIYVAGERTVRELAGPAADRARRFAGCTAAVVAADTVCTQQHLHCDFHL